MHRSLGRVILGWMCGFLLAFAWGGAHGRDAQLATTLTICGAVGMGVLVVLLVSLTVRDRAARLRVERDQGTAYFVGRRDDGFETSSDNASALAVAPDAAIALAPEPLTEMVPAAVLPGVTARAGARQERRQFIVHNVVAGAGTWIAGILGLLLQALVSHHFSPGVYGQAFAVFTFFTVLTQPAAGFSRMIAWSTSRELATKGGSDGESASLLRSTNRRLLIAGFIIAAGFVAGAPLLAGFLHVPASFVILGALGVPFLLSTAPLQASLQGEQRWGAWSSLSIAIAASRVVFVAIGVLLYGVLGVLAGISVAAFVVYLAALAMVWGRLRRGQARISWRPQRNFLIVAVASTIMIATLMGSDVLLVEHLFNARQGGQFSSVTVTSRALFFAMGSVTSVLFPKVAARHANARRTTSVVAASVALGLIGGLAGLAVFSLGSHVILRSFSGNAYVAGSSYIGWYALGMPLLATVVMLSNSLQSLADLRLLWVLGAGTLLKPVLILFFHQSLLMVSVVGDISILTVLLSLAATYVVQERNLQRRAVREAPAAQGENRVDASIPSHAGRVAGWTATHRSRLSEEPDAVRGEA